MQDDKKYKLLLVDDDKFLLDMYAMKFKTSGHTVSTAVGGNDALTKLRAGESPDALILDIIMPVMDGLELLETIRKENLCPQSAVIMLTNETDPAKIEKAKSLGVAGYIVKATSIPSEVVTEVISILNNKKS
jgi:two-component system, chemotaxis family, chemotaxis protein CheY